VRNDREHRTEDLFLRDPHAVVDVHEERRLDVPALLHRGRSSAAAGDLRAFLLAGADVALDAITLARGDERPAERGRVHRIADAPITDRCGERVTDLAISTARSEDARRRRARLAVVDQRTRKKA